MSPIVSDVPTSVYRYYDDAGVLLYVGITGRGTQRNSEHARRAEWWPHVARQDVDHLASRSDALIRERDLITELQPPFNTQHNVDPRQAVQTYWAARSLHESAPSPVELHQELGGEVPVYPIRTSSEGLSYMTAPAHWGIARLVEIAKGARFIVDQSIVAGKLTKIERSNYSAVITVGARKNSPHEAASMRVTLEQTKGDQDHLFHARRIRVIGSQATAGA